MKEPRNAPMKIQIMMCPLKYMANNMTKYATANCSICRRARTSCSISVGRTGVLSSKALQSVRPAPFDAAPTTPRVELGESSALASASVARVRPWDEAVVERY